MTVRLLCVGDMHLGRSPGGLGGERLGLLELDARQLGPRAAWARTVAHALDEEVDAVLLAGDLVDAEDDLIEAYDPLKRGVEQLVAASIRVLGVAGNHDVKVLPRLADQVPGFQLLGRGGVWERAVIAGRQGGELHVLGWSFPQPRVTSSPLPVEPTELLARGGAPLIGLLHADLDASPSPYAPVRRAELASAPVDAWILGHVHRPGDLSGSRPIGYLGSLTALDAAELGARGPWLLEADSGAIRLEQVPLAPLRFEELEVDVSGAEAREDVALLALQAVQERARRDPPAGELGPRAIGLRLLFTGRTHDRPMLEKAAEDARDLIEHSADLVLFVERALVRTRPAVDLVECARRRDPLGLLAQQLLSLEQDDASRAPLLARARAELARGDRLPVFGGLEKPPLDDEEVLRWLRAAGDHLLDGLLRQEARHGGAS